MLCKPDNVQLLTFVFCCNVYKVSWCLVRRSSTKIQPLEATNRKFIMQYKKTENSVFTSASNDLLRAFKVAAAINRVTTGTEETCRKARARGNTASRQKMCEIFLMHINDILQNRIKHMRSSSSSQISLNYKTCAGAKEYYVI